MSINLHPDIETFIREQVGTNGFRSPDEVVTEALYQLWQRTQEDETGSRAVASPDSRH
jgi:Arc/MetJ-type ribon-helix-helix transcriptional regulator